MKKMIVIWLAILLASPLIIVTQAKETYLTLDEEPIQIDPQNISIPYVTSVYVEGEDYIITGKNFGVGEESHGYDDGSWLIFGNAEYAYCPSNGPLYYWTDTTIKVRAYDEAMYGPWPVQVIREDNIKSRTYWYFQQGYTEPYIDSVNLMYFFMELCVVIDGENFGMPNDWGSRLEVKFPNDDIEVFWLRDGDLGWGHDFFGIDRVAFYRLDLLERNQTYEFTLIRADDVRSNNFVYIHLPNDDTIPTIKNVTVIGDDYIISGEHFGSGKISLSSLKFDITEYFYDPPDGILYYWNDTTIKLRAYNEKNYGPWPFKVTRGKDLKESSVYWYYQAGSSKPSINNVCCEWNGILILGDNFGIGNQWGSRLEINFPDNETRIFNFSFDPNSSITWYDEWVMFYRLELLEVGKTYELTIIRADDIRSNTFDYTHK